MQVLDQSVGTARAALAKPQATAVHEVRKALRRIRAISDLVQLALPRRTHKSIRKKLRGARRALGTARDHAVMPDVVERLGLDDVDRDDLRVAIEAAMVGPGDDLHEALATSAACAAEQAGELAAALPETLDWDTLVDGARTLYREARTARRAAKASRRAFHRWRRRTKELTYQLDVLARIDGDRVAAVKRELEQASEAQGSIVDVIMVRDIVRRHGSGELLDVIDAHLAPMMKETRRASRAVFRTKAREFGRNLRARGAKTRAG